MGHRFFSGVPHPYLLGEPHRLNAYELYERMKSGNRSGKRSAIVLLVVVASGFLIWFFSCGQTKQPKLTLTSVKHTVESGTAVVIFRVDVSDNRRAEIRQVEQTIEGVSVAPNWSSQGNPMGKAFRGWKEFGVLAPTNNCAWHLEVGVALDESNIPRRLKLMALGEWMALKVTHRFDRTPKMIWTTFFPAGWMALQSAPITNAVRQVDL